MATILRVGAKRRCDARCHGAKQSGCNCICGGRYHGALLQGPGELNKRLQTNTQWPLGKVGEGDITDVQTPLILEEALTRIKEPETEANDKGENGMAGLKKGDYS